MFNFFSKSKIKDESTKNSNIVNAIGKIFSHKSLNQEMLDDLEEQLIMCDISPDIAHDTIIKLSKQKFVKNIDIESVKTFLANEITSILQPYQKELNLSSINGLKVIIFNGVNGAGKTTTIGKIAFNLAKDNHKVLMAACDSFRAAAVEQLQIWSKRANCEIILPKNPNEDPASIAYRAVKEAAEKNYDILLIDTAGRLQNKKNLMDELAKINRVIKKIDENAPHENILVVDSTTGQNSALQLESFDKLINISGLIITKLDGSAKGGMILSLSKKFQKPIYAIGVGEKITDLCEFNAQNFANSLLSLD
jgi:fused signal recognition particle receptor